MNSEQRIKRTLEHKEPDRIPFDLGSGGVTGIIIGAYRKLLLYLGIQKENIPTLDSVQWQLAKIDENVLERLKVDTRGLSPNPPSTWKLLIQEEGNYKYFTDEWGIKWRMPQKGGHYYDLYQSLLQGEISQEDIDRYPWPNFEDPTVIKGLKEKGEGFRRKGKAIVGERMGGGFFEFSFIIRGFENFYLDLAANPSMACYLMDKLLEIRMAYWKMFLKHLGEYCLVVGEADDLGVQDTTMISPEMYRKYVKPRHKKLFSHIKKFAPHCYIFLHSCGSVYDVIPDLIEVGVDILNPVQVSAAKMDTRKLKEEFGKDLTFWGNRYTKITPLWNTRRSRGKEIKMNLRERFLEIMRNFNTNIRSIRWEFGYWGETINNWYKQGLPKKNPATIPSEFTSSTASLYTKAWTCENKFRYKNGVKGFPDGIGIAGGGVYWPTQGLPLDSDVKDYFNMDQTQQLVDINLLFYPMFEAKTLEEDEDRLKYIDVDGITRLFLKKTATLPSGWDYPIKDEKSWEKTKEERINFNNVRERLPKNWDKLVKEYKSRDYPLTLGGYPYGFFGTLVHLLGYDHLFYAYFDKPKLIHNILKTFTELWIAMYSEILADVEIDAVHIWEDISFGKGSMVSPNVIKEFMLPYYKRFTSFLKNKGIDIILIDTDGNCMDIIPLFIEGGITGMYPFEVNCGMDIIKVRKKFPKLQMLGGIPKSDISLSKKRIDEILEPVDKVLKTGGYVPFADHLVPPEIRWENFKYYRNKLNSTIDKFGK